MSGKNKLTAEIGSRRSDGNSYWIRIEDSDLEATLEISFQRTVRVEDSEYSNYLPSDKGALPLFNVRDLSGLPGSLQEGTVLLPIHVREAMWINFRPQAPYLIRVFTGGINAVSGKADKVKSEDVDQPLDIKNLRIHDDQDYVVVPPQKWLDGFAVGEGLVQQFVGVPSDSGYATDEQLTGIDLGGLRFEVTPLKHDVIPMERRKSNAVGPDADLAVSSSPKGQQTQQIYVKTPRGETLTMEVDMSDTVQSIKERVPDSKGSSADDITLTYDGKLLANERTLWDYGVKKESTLHFILKLKGGGGGSGRGKMRVAAGGKIKQNVEKDPYNASDWDRERTIAVNISMVNALLLSSVTGTIAPEAGPEAKDYDGPYFALGDEDKPSNVKGNFTGVKSVATLNEKMDHPVAKAAARIARTEKSHPVVRVQRVAKN